MSKPSQPKQKRRKKGLPTLTSSMSYILQLSVCFKTANLELIGPDLVADSSELGWVLGTKTEPEAGQGSIAHYDTSGKGSRKRSEVFKRRGEGQNPKPTGSIHCIVTGVLVFLTCCVQSSLVLRGRLGVVR